MSAVDVTVAALEIVAVFGDGRATLDLMNDTSHLGGGFRV